VFPLSDENPTRLTPVVTLAIIAINVVVWVFVEGAGFQSGLVADAVCRYGMIPAEITHMTGGLAGISLGPGSACRFGGLTWQTLLTSMFLHGSWLHLLGNMWFLWVFGNNIEDSMGHARFVVFYLLVGLIAGAAQLFSGPRSPVPTVGASGAISGVMGAYLLLYPRVRIKTLLILVIFITIIYVPAWFILLEWFAIQLFEKWMTPASMASVAYSAHIGGFLAGLLFITLFRDPQLVAAKRGLIAPRERGPGGWS
jgi:rhomboid family protein